MDERPAGFMPDGRYEVMSFATDAERSNVWPMACSPPPIPRSDGKSTRTDYVYVMQFADGKIAHMTKIWNAPWAMKELGWV